MKAKEFDQVNIRIGENQPDYITLPAHIVRDEEQAVITCFEFSDEEIEKIISDRCIWHHQITFKKAMQPIRISVYNPFLQDESDLESERFPQEACVIAVNYSDFKQYTAAFELDQLEQFNWVWIPSIDKVHGRVFDHVFWTEKAEKLESFDEIQKACLIRLKNEKG
jgi:hypothetical protein